MATVSPIQRPAPPLPSLSEPTVPINRFPSPPPVPMPPFTFPLSEGVSSQLSMLDSKHFSFINGEEYSSPGSSRSSSRKSSTAGLEGGDLARTPKKHVRVDSRIVVPAITLTPPQAPTAYPILKSYSIDNPFLPKQPISRPSLSARPSLMSFATFSPSKRLRRKTTRRMSDEEEAEETIGELTIPRNQKPKRSFSLPSTINTALDWALSTSTSAPSSPTKQYATSVAELEKFKSQTSEGGFSLPQIVSTGTSSLFSPPPSANGVFSFNNLPSRDKKAVPHYSSRRRPSKSPLLILLFPVLVIALHIYFSFVDVRFMHLGHDLVFGSPLAHRHTYAEGLHLDMHDAWDQFEEKLSFRKRGMAVDSYQHDDQELADPEPAEAEDDVVAFLRGMQEAADRNGLAA